MLKAVIDSLDEVDKEFRDLYKEDEEEGVFVLEVEGDPNKTKLAEFRSNNRRLFREKKKLEAELDKFKGLDPDDIEKGREALDKLNALEDKSLLEAGKLDEVISKRTEAMRKDFATQVKAKDNALEEIGKERDALKSKLGGFVLESRVQQSIGKVGAIRAGALPDIINRARSLWKVNADGDLVAIRDGEPVYNKKGDALSMDEWSAGLLEEAPFLFEGGEGGDSQGGKKGGGGGRITRIASDDDDAISKNLEGIASGKVRVGE